MGRSMTIQRLGTPPDNPVAAATRERLDRALKTLDARLASQPWLAGREFTAADIMTVFCATTMRLFLAFDLAAWPNIRAWLQRVGERPAYRRAMQKGDPSMEPMLA
jgi:glutathione S-transferase